MRFKELIAIGLTLVVTALSAQETNPANASYRIRVGRGRELAYGSATAISRNVLVTNNHVVGQTGTRVVIDQPPTGVAFSGSVIASEPAIDLALILVSSEGELRWAEHSSTDPVQQQTYQLYGFPFAGPLRKGTGQVINQARMDSGEPTIWFSIQVNDGDSGGGIFDSQNRLVAITHGRQLSGEVSAIPISAMIGLVEQTKSRLTSQGVAFRYHQKCEKCGEYHEEGIELTQL